MSYSSVTATITGSSIFANQQLLGLYELDGGDNIVLDSSGTIATTQDPSFTTLTVNGDASFNGATELLGDVSFGGDISANTATFDGMVTMNDTLSVSPDTDVTAVIGRAKIGYTSQNDRASFAHYEHMSDTNYALQQTNTGITNINAASNQNIHFNVANSNIMTVNGSNGYVGIGTTNPTEEFEVYPDTDATGVIGRAKIGKVSTFSDFAGFAHYDRDNNNDYALQQNSNGATFIGAAASQAIQFNQGGSAKAKLNSSGHFEINNRLQVGGYITSNGNDYISWLQGNGQSYHYWRFNWANQPWARLYLRNLAGDDVLSCYARSFNGTSLSINGDPDVDSWIQLTSTTGGSPNYWRIKVNPDDNYNDYIGFYYGTNLKGYIHNNVGNAHMNNFTGQHRTFIKDVPYSNTSKEGLIVCSNQNNYIKMSGGVEYGKEGITINESLPVVSISSKVNDKSCFGVISNSEDPDKREETHGVFGSLIEKELGDTRFFINSVGEGAVWVSNKNGPLESGDYITTSAVPGYGQLQNDDILHNYTVAKITMDCDFNPPLVNKKQIKRIDIAFTGDASGNYFDMSGNMLYGKDLSDNDVKNNVYNMDIDASGVLLSVTENILDGNGEIQWEDTGEQERKYNIRHVDASGNILTEAQYNAKITANEEAYICAFVGCTYHCG